MVEKRAERLPISVDIDKKNRLVMQAELSPCHDLEHLVERADAARQYRECVRPFGHYALALVHAAGGHQLGEPGMRQFGVAQRAGYDADHPSAGIESGIGQQAHQPDPSAAKDDFDPRPGQCTPEIAGGVTVDFADRAGGAAIDAYPADAHGHSWIVMDYP